MTTRYCVFYKIDTRRIFLHTIGILFFAILAVIPAQALHPLVRNFTRSEDKAGTQNWDITQDKNLELFFANNEGLLSFDGSSWHTTPIGNHTNVRAVLYDSISNRIYAGAFNELGYYVHDTESKQFTYHSLIEKIAPNERQFNEIWNILCTGNHIFFQSDNVVMEYHNDTIVRYNFDHKIETSAIIGHSLLIATQADGIMALNGKMFIPIPGHELLYNKKVCAIIPYRNMPLFVTDFHGLYIFNGKEIVAMKTPIDNFLKQNQAFCAATDGNKIVYGTVARGIIIHDLEKESYTYVNTYSGLQNNTVLSAKFDHLGNIWLGLDKGIDYVLDNSPIRSFFDSPNNIYGSGYASLIKDGRLYLGTNQGLYSTRYPVDNSPEPLRLTTCLNSQVWTLEEIDGTLFCGNDYGAYVIEGNTPHFIPGTCGTWAFVKLENKPGLILGSSYQGLYILKKQNGTWICSHYVKGFEFATGMIAEDKEGYIWISHWMNGVYRLKLNATADSVIDIKLYDDQQGLAGKQNNTIHRIGNLMVFSAENGFFVYNPQTEGIEPHNKLNTLFGKHPGNTLRLHIGPNNDIWAISPKYIATAISDPTGYYSLDTTSFRPLLNKLIIGFEHLNFIDDRNVILSTEDGFLWIDMYKTMPKLDTNALYIKHIYSVSSTDSLIYSKEVGNTPLKISHTLNSLRFECSWPEYRENNAILYSFMLENYDEQYSAPQTSNVYQYQQLRQGVYTLHVKAYNTYDSSEAHTSITFEILAPWYSSGVAVFAYTLILILLIYLLIRFIKAKSEKAAHEIRIQKEHELEEQQKRHLAESQEKEREIVTLKNQQLEHDLRHKSQELSHTTANIIRKNEILMNLIASLNKIDDNVNNQTPSEKISKQIKHLQKQIQENIEHDNDWHRFEENFDVVYENFLSRLSKTYPQLNVTDRRLCAYLKMGLSSKEIAPLLNMSVRSVEMTRYRLRKKMGLERDTNLAVFLQQL